MVEVHQDEPQNEKRELNLEEGAAPEPVTVYDRPESSGPSTMSIIIGILVLLLLLAVAYLVLQGTIL
jgi:hypothetical protein